MDLNDIDVSYGKEK